MDLGTPLPLTLSRPPLGCSPKEGVGTRLSRQIRSADPQSNGFWDSLVDLRVDPDFDPITLVPAKDVLDPRDSVSYE